MRLGRVAGALWLFAAGAAYGQITDLSVNATQSSESISVREICQDTVSGTAYGLGGKAGDSRNTVSVTASSPTAFTTRLVAELCTDTGGATAAVPPIAPTPGLEACAPSPGFISTSLDVLYADHFDVTAPAGTAYRLTVEHSIAGAIDIVNDGAGTHSTGTMSQVAAALSGSTIEDPRGDLNLTAGLPQNALIIAGTTTLALANTQTYLGEGTGSPSAQTITVSWNASCFSPADGWECGLRMGLPCSIVGGPALYGDVAITAAAYPGSPSRTQSTDGNFLTVSLEYCGDSIVQSDGRLDEQCDQGNTDPVSGNGQPTSCCAADCTWSGIDPCYDGNGNEHCDLVPTPTMTATVTPTVTPTPYPCAHATDCVPHLTPGYSYECVTPGPE